MAREYRWALSVRSKTPRTCYLSGIRGIPIINRQAVNLGGGQLMSCDVFVRNVEPTMPFINHSEAEEAFMPERIASNIPQVNSRGGGP